MANEDVADRVRRIISETLSKPLEDIAPSAHFVDDLEADSLDIVELVMEIERSFDVEIPDDEAERIRRVQDAIDYVLSTTT